MRPPVALPSYSTRERRAHDGVSKRRFTLCTRRRDDGALACMSSLLQERIVAYANLLALSKELDQLRERVKKAEQLYTAKPSKQKRASFHRRARRIH